MLPVVGATENFTNYFKRKEFNKTFCSIQNVKKFIEKKNLQSSLTKSTFRWENLRMRSNQIIFSVFMFFSICLFACASPQQNTTSVPDQTPEAVTPSIVPTSTPSAVLTIQPTEVGSVLGTILYDDTKDILSINLDTGETKKLVSRDELQLMLGVDKSAESYTYGYAKPMDVKLSPDFSKALITVCANLDVRLRCVFEDYVYSLEEKSVIRLEKPANTYGVYWRWSPDGSVLAGAAWTYDEANYLINHFYAIDSDGTNLRVLAPVTNDHWQIVWHPGSQVIHPLTFITNFRSVFADGSKDMDIPIDELEWDDKVECLTFSPDENESAFVVRREIPSNHDFLYVSSSDFEEISLVAEYDIDSKYGCQISWSPDQDFVNVAYEYAYREETGALDQSEEFPPQNKLFSVTSGTPVELPEDTRVCGWAPDGNLVYEGIDFAGVSDGVDVVNLPDFNPLSLPEDFQHAIEHCPVQWLREDLTLNIPEGLSVPNACHPGGEILDEAEMMPIPSLFDIKNVTTTLDGESMTVVIFPESTSQNISDYITPDVIKFPNGWEVLVDVDNNFLSGDRLGMEYRFIVNAMPANGNSPEYFMSLFMKYDPAGKTYTRAGEVNVALDPGAGNLTITGTIPGISETSRLVFLSRMTKQVVNSTPDIVGDQVCK